MTDIHQLLGKLAAEEARLHETEFLAPCTRGGKVRASVAKMVRTFASEPQDFEGWGIFQPLNLQVARVVDEPTLPQLSEYLQLLPSLRLFLVYPLSGQSWLAYPANESDARQRFGAVRPRAVHLVTEGEPFEPIVARVDGGACWFEESDRRADPQPTERLRERLQLEVEPEEVRFGGMTPEMRAVYDLAWQQTVVGRQQRQQQRPPHRGREARGEEERLRSALRQGGGELQGFRDRGDFWQVEWTTADGERHASAVDKGDLTVISSGICLSGRDRDFDLQSLVGVIEQQEW